MTMYVKEVLDLLEPTEIKPKKERKQRKPKKMIPKEKPIPETDEPVEEKPQEPIVEKPEEPRSIEDDQVEKLQEKIKLKEKELAEKEAILAKKKRKKVDTDLIPTNGKKEKKPQNPPSWFTDYIKTFKKEEYDTTNQKKPVSEIKKEAQEIAQDKWQDGLIRDSSKNEMSLHQRKMYNSIFPGR